MEIIDDLNRLKEGDWIKFSDTHLRYPMICVVEKLIQPVRNSNILQCVYTERGEPPRTSYNYETKSGLFQVVQKEKRNKRFKTTKNVNRIYRGNEFMFKPKTHKFEWQMKMVEQFNRRDQVIIHKLSEDEINKIKSEEIIKALKREGVEWQTEW